MPSRARFPPLSHLIHRHCISIVKTSADELSTFCVRCALRDANEEAWFRCVVKLVVSRVVFGSNAVSRKCEMDLLVADVSVRPVCTLVGHTDTVWCVAWHPNGDVIASCGADRSVRIWKAVGKYTF